MAGRPGRSSPQAPAPARKGKPGAGRRPSQPTVLGRVFARPGVIVAGASFAAVMTGIVANALLLQKGHHPSPLFSPAPTEVAAPQPIPVPPPVPRQVVEQPVAEAAPAANDTPAAPPAPPAVHTPKKAVARPAAPHAAVPAHKTAGAAHPDLIGQLLGKQH